MIVISRLIFSIRLTSTCLFSKSHIIHGIKDLLRFASIGAKYSLPNIYQSSTLHLALEWRNCAQLHNVREYQFCEFKRKIRLLSVNFPMA
jgi:hypothetical protein